MIRLAVLLCISGFCTVLSSCPESQLAVYKMVLKTEWSSSRFPKQYPEWRPNAQWSKVVGRTHNDGYRMWKMEQLASAGVKYMAETGKSDKMEFSPKQSILDDFYAPPIVKGVGETASQLIVDGNHTKVSLMSKIVPSPDWFIGVDSFDLCSNGKWLDTVTLDLGPLDAGTQSGFTFTAPKWATDPPETISAITAHHPNHPANSFFYPNLPKLPRLAYVQLLKMKEYVLRDVFNHASSQNVETVVPYKGVDESEIPVYRAAETYQKDEPSAVKLTKKAKASDKTVINAIEGQKMAGKRVRSGNGKKRSRKTRDCRVSEWSEWSECSKSCGFGEKTRERRILKYPSKRGGRPCPVLVEKQWCGSARNCRNDASTYFNWQTLNSAGHN